MRMKSLAARGLVTAGGGVLLVGLFAGAASAHVTITPSSAVAGAYSVLTFSVGHGCDGSSTTQVKIQMPSEINAVTPTINQGWTVKKTMAKLATPVTDAHGAQITERVVRGRLLRQDPAGRRHARHVRAVAEAP